ncbi:hypothetical protein DFH07DRAFT_956554 [Mycena maculata]|uniref:Uncharacterized protein n=1 Tax=Mycena maculata TaxID=230809 RepID=A0AAD7NJQ5_9AGAR|nr:hypothetical protein DFH07DRAFT_956554 [Mycena maculata]
MSTRTSARKVSSSKISTAISYLQLDSDEEMEDTTLVNSEEEQEEEDEEVDEEEDEGDEEEEEGDEEEDADEAGDGAEDEEEEEASSEDDNIVRQKWKGGTRQDDELEDEEDDTDEDGLPATVTVPQKRKRGRGKKRDHSLPPASARKIQYTICIFSLDQMHKSKASRGRPQNRIIDLDSDEPWDRIKAQTLAKISDVLNPTQLQFDDYNVLFTVPHHLPDPLTLNEDNYPRLVTNALEIQKIPVAKIIVEPKIAANIAGNEQNDNGEHAKGKKNQERDILPANTALNAQIGAIRARWMCPTPGGPCGSVHCYVSPTDPEHFPLGNAHVESWAAAMLKGSQFAQIDKPPRNDLFDKVSPAHLAERSPLLQRRLELRDQAAANKVPAAPQVHFNFPPELANFLRPAAPIPPVAPPAPMMPVPTTTMLIPHPFVPGPHLTIMEFCNKYQLDNDICVRFTDEKFKNTSAFKYVELAELKEMGFRKGEIAELKVAVEMWAQMPEQ